MTVAAGSCDLGGLFKGVTPSVKAVLFRKQAVFLGLIFVCPLHRASKDQLVFRENREGTFIFIRLVFAFRLLEQPVRHYCHF